MNLAVLELFAKLWKEKTVRGKTLELLAAVGTLFDSRQKNRFIFDIDIAEHLGCFTHFRILIITERLHTFRHPRCD